MALDQFDLDGYIKVIDFTLTIDSVVLSTDKQKLEITFTGYSFPERTDVDLYSYEYSLDNGVSWDTMTTSSTITGLTFEEEGTEHTFEWDVKDDAGMAFYNIPLRIRFNAISGVDETGLVSGTFYLERIIENLSTENSASPFPDSYSGLSGSDLMQNAPKVVS